MTTDHCGECDLEIPAHPEYQLLHLFREHPREFRRIEREYCQELTELNDCRARPVSGASDADLRERLDTAAKRSMAMGGRS